MAGVSPRSLAVSPMDGEGSANDGVVRLHCIDARQLADICSSSQFSTHIAIRVIRGSIMRMASILTIPSERAKFGAEDGGD
jgi:hypothetical protein